MSSVSDLRVSHFEVGYKTIVFVHAVHDIVLVHVHVCIHVGYNMGPTCLPQIHEMIFTYNLGPTTFGDT